MCHHRSWYRFLPAWYRSPPYDDDLVSTPNPLIGYRAHIRYSGEAVKYDSSFHAFRSIIANEGVSSLFKGAGANILRGVAGAGVLSIYDQVQLIMFGKAYKGGSGWNTLSLRHRHADENGNNSKNIYQCNNLGGFLNT